MKIIKKYLWVMLFNILAAAIIFVPTGIYIYVKFGFASECIHVGTKVSVIGVFFIVVLGLYMLAVVNSGLRNISNWLLRFILRSLYYIGLVAACVFLINKMCDTVNTLAQAAMNSIGDLTSAIVYTSLLFLVCFILSRAASFFAAWMKSKIDDYETLKSARRAEKAIEKASERDERKKVAKAAKKAKREVYLDE